ncbi:MAG TPA: hypothetical protein VMW91_10060 [Desulfosporosinus sp.]|nr:hypothetical protein [Desulfosporosinus sp.]
MAPRHQSITASSHPWRCSNLERPVRVLDKPYAFLHALSTALIDAIPLSVLSKLRNFLWLGSTRGGTTMGLWCCLRLLTQMCFACFLGKLHLTQRRGHVHLANRTPVSVLHRRLG